MSVKAEHNFVPYSAEELSEEVMLERSRAFFGQMNERRTIRHFSDKPVDIKVIQSIVRTASTAPSGAHKQPWVFCVVSDPALRSQIRKLAEEEEYRNYHGRMSEEWVKDLEPFDTDWNKPFIETAAYLIVVFKQAFDLNDEGSKKVNYYVNESVGIAMGFLLAAIHNAGLCALTHTPSPMNFLAKVLNRPKNERPFLLIPVGYPAENCTVPDLERKGLDEVMITYE